MILLSAHGILALTVLRPLLKAQYIYDQVKTFNCELKLLQKL